MRRRTYEFEIAEIILCIAVIICTIVLFFKAGALSVLYPVVFGLGAVLSFLYAFDGIWYNKNRVIKKSRVALFMAIATALAFACWLSIRVIYLE